jgi:hypothetical protein
VIRKTFTVSFIAAILTAKVAVALPIIDGSWYWPFVDYPMYRHAHFEGAVYRDWRMSVLVPGPEGSPPDTIQVTADDIGIYFFVLDGVVRAVMGWARGEEGSTEERAQRAAERIEQAAVASLPYPEFAILLEEREFVIGRRGPESLDPPWEAIHTWQAEEALASEALAVDQ